MVLVSSCDMKVLAEPSVIDVDREDEDKGKGK